MLKNGVRSEMKEAVILLVFTGLLSETLTKLTLVFVIFGAILVWFQKRPGAVFRNVATLGFFGAYWFMYGKVIDPEIGLNFLTSIMVLKLLEKETPRDHYMIFFGLILLMSAGSLFQKNISYVAFFALSFLILIQDFYRDQKLSAGVAALFKAMIWVLPLATLLFFFAPRMMNPFEMEKGTPKAGEVGYTPDVNISNLESLASNEKVVFQATLTSPLTHQELYWRANTLSFTDGWNWPLMPRDRSQVPLLKDSPLKAGSEQNIRVFSQQEFFFGLDHPSYFVLPQGTATLTETRSLVQARWQPHFRYQSISLDGPIELNEDQRNFYLQSGLNQAEKKWVLETFKSTELAQLEAEVKNYFMKEQFSYSLSPGRVNGFLDFMQTKKIGFCSHYASALAQILRVKKIKARLVSGFLGGTYNSFGGFYQISQNDAHVWVEALKDGQWQRLDPSGWIAPDRIRLGGEAYMELINPQGLSNFKFLGRRFSWLLDFQQWFAQWDYKFSQWLDEMDYYGQVALLDKFNLKRNWIFSLIPVILAFFIGLYTWSLSRLRPRASEIELLWKSFQKKLLKRGVDLPLHSLGQGDQLLEGQDIEVREIWKILIEVSFQSETKDAVTLLKKKIRNL